MERKITPFNRSYMHIHTTNINTHARTTTHHIEYRAPHQSDRSTNP